VRVIVIGGGEVGQHISRTLSADRHDVTVVDQDAGRVEALAGSLDAMVAVGNGASPKFLHRLGASDADLVCAVTQSDEVNIIAALSARQLGAGQTVARVRDSDYFEQDESFARDVLGIDFVIHPERATAEDMAASVLLPGAVHVEHFADGKVTMAECVLTDRSPLLGKSLGERVMPRPHHVAGLERAGRVIAPDDGHRPKVGDHLFVVAARNDIGPVVSTLAGRAPQVKDVVIFGAGRVGLPLAEQLEAESSMRITVMESDADRARVVAERLRRSTVLHEEGLSKETLLAHGIDRAGAFVAAAGDDRANLLAALNAKQLGADLCLAVVSREEFTPLVEALKIDAGFSPRLVTAEAILRAVRGRNVEGVHLMLGGAEVLDVRVDDGCKADGRTVDSAAVMASTRVAAIVRNGRVIIPGPDERIHGDDRVITFNARSGVSKVGPAFKAS
jgi:trk system potassium uptake protein TrkA